MSQKSIILFSGVEILPNVDKQHAIDYLKRYCTIDDLGDSIYIKKLGNDGTTFGIDFNFNEICVIRKIKDKNGCNISDILFESTLDDCDDDSSNYCGECNHHLEYEHNMEFCECGCHGEVET